MDREHEEMQFLGLINIYKEAYKIIFTWQKIFTRITTTLILRHSFIYLTHREVSNILLRKIKCNANEISFVLPETQQFDKLSDVLSSEWTTLWLFKLTYFTVFLVLSFLSTTTVVYTIASIYTTRDATFKKVMIVVPKAWKRLMITFLWTFAFFAYNIMTIFVFIISVLTLGVRNAGLEAIVLTIIL